MKKLGFEALVVPPAPFDIPRGRSPVTAHVSLMGSGFQLVTSFSRLHIRARKSLTDSARAEASSRKWSGDHSYA
jgi:hypothetical protein